MKLTYMHAQPRLNISDLDLDKKFVLIFIHIKNCVSDPQKNPQKNSVFYCKRLIICAKNVFSDKKCNFTLCVLKWSKMILNAVLLKKSFLWSPPTQCVVHLRTNYWCLIIKTFGWRQPVTSAPCVKEQNRTYDQSKYIADHYCLNLDGRLQPSRKGSVVMYTWPGTIVPI